jgi:D-tyrosyl-tRNA(Tyr) deacylase
MRVVVQRVVKAAVSVHGNISGEIGPGLLVLAGFEEVDQATDLDWMTQKLVRLRIFPDEQGVMNLSVVDAGGEILAVSQFTLYASTRKGNRPSWARAARGEVSQPLFERFVATLSTALGRAVPTGVFGAEMQISLVNDGPVTITLDSRNPE